MLLLANSYATPEENLSFEENYFHSFEEDTLRLWRSPSSVIIGKHQNAFSEANLNFCFENKIPIIRRISGGGTVFHDLGNINFSFFRYVDKGNQINYNDNLRMVSEMLNSLGYDVKQNVRHDLFLNGFKVSGNAQHISKGRALHHGTILYDSNLNILSKAIKREFGQFEDKSVKSVRSKVSNLRSIKDVGTSSRFFDILRKAFIDRCELKYRPIDQGLTNPKYFSNDWNFGYGPKFKLTSSDSIGYIKLDVDRGCQILSVESDNEEWTRFFKKFKDKKFDYLEISKLLSSDSSHSNAILKKILFS